MKADNITLQGILNSPNRYIIPVFQRYYSWKQKEWAILWEDLMELRDEENAGTHFMGALVFVPETISRSFPAYLTIDGQQRLLTLSILLCALRNIARSHGFTHMAAEITDTYLVHPYKQGEDHFRLYPRQRDRGEYLALLDHSPFSGERGEITQCLIYFLRHIQETIEITEPALRDFFTLVATGLEFVYITLDEENPYRIFKSLNSTGVNLSEADLIRNFMLMEAGTNSQTQDAFDDEFWRPLERQFEAESGVLDSKLFSAFFHHFLMSNGQHVPLSSTFYQFERRYRGNEFDVRGLTKQLQTYASFYNMIRGQEAHPKKEINRALHKLRAVNSRHTYPLLLHLLMRLENGDLYVSEFAEIAQMLMDFIQKWHESDRPTRGFSRWFVSAVRLLDEAPVKNLGDFLQQKLK
jgi:hypothetical protein